MAYSAGDTILDDEYNAFVNNSSSPVGINHIGGTGSGVYGLGESAVSTVSPGNTINASQWNSLFSAMDVIAAHAGSGVTVSSTTSKSAGDSIAIISALTNDIATLATAVAGGCTGTTALSTSGALQAPVSSSTWNNSFTTQMSVTFANANKMRHFFNAGGKVRVTPTRIGSGLAGDGSGGIDPAWTNLYNSVGNLDIKAQTSSRSGSGETLNTNGLDKGFHDLTTSYQTILQMNDDTYPYASNSVRIEAKLNAAVGSATVITIKTTATDGTTNYTYSGNNTSNIDSQAYRNGQHKHSLYVISTTSASLTNAHTYSSTATVSNSTT
jgi:hypothetical protein